MKTRTEGLFVIFALAVVGAKGQTVQTTFATGAGPTSATLNGVVLPNGPTQCHFNVNTGAGVTNSTPWAPVTATGLSIFSAPFTGYAPGQTVFDQLECGPIGGTGGANIAGQFVSFTAPAVAPPVFDATMVLSAGAPALPGISPGEIVSFYGQNMAVTAATAPTGPILPTSLGGATVSFGGMSGYFLYASPTQVNVQAPFLLPPGSIPVTVAVDHGGGLILSTTVQITVKPANPGVFGYADLQGNNLATPGAILRPFSDGSLYVTAYMTGLGAVANWYAAGVPAPGNPLATSLAFPSAAVDNIPATVLWSGLQPGAIGEWQVNIKLPPGLAPGPHIVQMSTSGGSVSFSVTTAAQ